MTDNRSDVEKALIPVEGEHEANAPHYEVEGQMVMGTHVITQSDIDRIALQKQMPQPIVGQTVSTVTVGTKPMLLLPNAGTLWVPGTYVPPSPPPPPSGFFLPPRPGWKVALQHNYIDLQSMPSDEWKYGGRPGGTNNCEWENSQVTFDPVEGMVYTTQWSAALDAWISGATGTSETWTPPLCFRVYERDQDWNIEGLNRIDLAWTNPWFYECDFYECAVVNGVMQPSAERIHNGNGNNVVPPIFDTYTPDFGSHCNEMELVDSQYNVYRDNAQVGSRTLAASDWAAICSQGKWLGVQDELYAIGTGDQSKVSKRSIHGVEILIPA